MSRYTLLPGGQDDSVIVVEEEKPGACVRCGSTDAAAFPLDKRDCHFAASATGRPWA